MSNGEGLPQQHWGRGIRALVVEDNLIDGCYLQRNLVALGCEVIAVVPTGSEALELCQLERPDVIFMDVMLLGEIDGIETTRRIQSQFTVPVIYVTLSPPPDSLESDGLRNLYLRKPIRRDELRAAIDTILRMEQPDFGATLGVEADETLDAFILYNAKSESILYVSPTYERVWGRPCASLYTDAHAWLEAVVEDDRARVRGFLSAPASEVDFRILRADGLERVIRARHFSIPSLPNMEVEGEVSLRAAIFEDVTPTRQIEEALGLTQQRLSSLLSSSSTVIYTRHNEPPYRITYLSDNIRERLGYEPSHFYEDEALWERLLHPEDALRVSEDGKSIDAAGQLTLEYRIRHESGRWIWLLDERRTIKGGDGRPREIVGSLLDVTERRNLEAQLRQAQKMEALGQLAGGVAHDFNNLLCVVLGYTEVALRSDQLGDDLRAALEEIHAAGQRAVSLTRQLLLFSRKQTLNAEPVCLNDIIAETKNILGRVIGEHITLDVALEDPLPSVKVDGGQLQQVLFNLCINARDAMPQGGRLSIRTRTVMAEATDPLSTPQRRVELSVADTGHGMDDETMRHIFEPFFTTKGTRGTGLGLATVFNIVKQNDGQLKVESRSGIGSMFTVSFPQCDGAAAPVMGTSDTGAAGGTETVLLVEDDEPLARFMSLVLERAGYGVLRARDGHEALIMCAVCHRSIDLVVTDVVMPGMIGTDLAERVRARHPQVRVLFMSGYGRENIAQFGVALEERAMLRKPFSALALQEKVRAALDQPESNNLANSRE